MIKIVFFGDVCGEPGRKAVRKVLPRIMESEKPDLVLANVENLAHGKGITVKTLEEMMRSGIQAFTGGNHVFSKKDLGIEAFEKYGQLIARPMNIPDGYPGRSAAVIETKKGPVLLGNMLGQVFMDKQFRDPISSPFTAVEDWIRQNKPEDYVASIMDFHAEATSEKIAFGYYCEGRISAVFGTHTHVPTADYKILPKGTAYITDVGMCGAAGSVLGVKKELSMERFLNEKWVAFDIPEDVSDSEVSYVIIEVDETNKKAVKVQGVHQIVDISK